VIFALDGYETYTLSIKPSFDYAGWIDKNIWFGGLIGLAIDAASGTYHRLSSDDISAHGQVIKVKLKPIVKKEEGSFIDRETQD
jgi:hypothetical protein